MGQLNKMQAGSAAPQAQSAAVSTAPTATPSMASATSDQSSATVSSAASSVIAPDTTTHSTAAGTTAKPSASKVAESEPEAVSSVTTEPPTASTSRAFVVKSETAHQELAKPTIAEVTQPTAPGALGIAINSDEKALAGIISSAPVRVPVAAPQHVRISQGVSQGLIAKRVTPVYPQQALQMRVQGSVLLDAKIGKDGSIVSVKRVSGDGVLARAATDAVKQWKYKPYYLNGEPVEIDTEITVNFKLP